MGSPVSAVQGECQLQGRRGHWRLMLCRLVLLWLMASFSQASMFTCLVNVVASWKMLKVKPTLTDWGNTKGS